MLNWNFKLCYLTILMHDFCFSTVYLRKKKYIKIYTFLFSFMWSKREKKSGTSTLKVSSLLLCGSSWEQPDPHSEWEPVWCPTLQGCTPPRVHHGPSDAGRDINNESWSRNHSGEHKGEDGAGWRRPQPAGSAAGFAPLILALMAVWWVHMGWHGFTYMFTCPFT